MQKLQPSFWDNLLLYMTVGLTLPLKSVADLDIRLENQDVLLQHLPWKKDGENNENSEGASPAHYWCRCCAHPGSNVTTSQLLSAVYPEYPAELIT